MATEDGTEEEAVLSEAAFDSYAGSSNGNGTGYEETTPEEGKPQRYVGPREPLTDLATMLAGFVGTGMVQSGGYNVPPGRMITFQAPLTGKAFDDLVSGTWLDTILQPFARKTEQAQAFAAVIIAPLLAAAYVRKPEIGPMVEGPLRQLISVSLVEMAPVLKAKKQEERKAARALGDVGEALGLKLENGQDAVTAMLNVIFAPPEGWNSEAEAATEGGGEQ